MSQLAVESTGLVDASQIYYYENMEGGHGGAADNKQQAFMTVLYIQFLYKTICKNSTMNIHTTA